MAADDVVAVLREASIPQCNWKSKQSARSEVSKREEGEREKEKNYQNHGWIAIKEDRVTEPSSSSAVNFTCLSSFRGAAICGIGAAARSTRSKEIYNITHTQKPKQRS